MRLITTISVLFLTIALIGCASSKSGTNSADNQEDSYVKVDQLANYINTLPRLTVRGSNVINTSVSTFRSSTSPLFILDGVQFGRNFGEVLQVLDNNQRVSVEFLSNSRATTRYGEEGRNGVLIINKQN